MHSKWTRKRASDLEACRCARLAASTPAFGASNAFGARPAAGGFGGFGGFGGAVVAPSANRSGRPSPTTQADAFSETGTYVAVSLDGGPCHHGLESTVVSLIDETTSLLRPGSVTKAEIEAVIGGLTDNPDHGHRSPGRLSRHYAPDAPIKINIASPSEGSVYLAFGPTNYTGPCFNLSPTQDLAEAARHLFAYLRQADALKPDLISVAPIPDQGLGFAINDRLKRAAGFVG